MTRIQNIKNDGGNHRVEIETDGDQAVVRFGSSFTLRVDESNLNKLRLALHDTALDLMQNRTGGRA